MKKIYYNGIIYTGNGSDAEAMAVENGRIIAVGDLETVRAACGDTRVPAYDLNGRFVVPGFNDSHMHLLNYGYTLQLVDLSGHTRSMEEMLQKLTDWIEEYKPEPGTWVVGRGWNHDYFQDEKRFPNRHDLDRVSTDHPILVIRACGHIACANTRAVEMAGISSATPQPEGGCFDVDEEGRPEGIFREYGVDLIKGAMLEPSKEEMKALLLLAMKDLNSRGITSVQTDDLAAFPEAPYERVLTAYRELEAEGQMTVKVYEQCLLSNLGLLRDFLGKGLRTGVGSDYFRIGPLKLLSDGSLGARTAYLSQPYADGEPGQRGIAVYSQEELDELIGLADREGMQIAVHCIGDGAMEMVVASLKKALRENPNRTDRRHGIVHCQITTKKLLEDFSRLKLHAYVQTIFLDYDSHIVESRVGTERAAETYRFKTLYSNGVSVSNGSDCPVEKPDVMAGIQCAVTRSALDGSKTFLPEEAFSVEEALETYTSMGARASFEEEKKGKLLPGMAADFVVLERDIRKVQAEKIKDTAVLETYIDGICVYRKQ